MWEQEILKRVSEKAKDYPTKALILLLSDITVQQKEQIEILESEIDGRSWSPSDWYVENNN